MCWASNSVVKGAVEYAQSLHNADLYFQCHLLFVRVSSRRFSLSVRQMTHRSSADQLVRWGFALNGLKVLNTFGRREVLLRSGGFATVVFAICVNIQPPFWGRMYLFFTGTLRLQVQMIINLPAQPNKSFGTGPLRRALVTPLAGCGARHEVVTHPLRSRSACGRSGGMWDWTPSKLCVFDAKISSM